MIYQTILKDYQLITEQEVCLFIVAVLPNVIKLLAFLEKSGF